MSSTAIKLSMVTPSSIATSPLLPSAKTGDQLKERIKLTGCNSLRGSRLFKPVNGSGGRTRVAAWDPPGLGSQLQPLDGRRLIMGSNRIKSASLVCASALDARCSQGQTQTVTREAPTITQAPVHSKEKSPDLDDGGAGFPPHDDGDGGGGGGGGGGNWSGGFFLFGFLAFLGFLKDKESEENYWDTRRR